MLKRSGTEAYCIKCEKWQPIEGREKEANSHQHWCADCIEAQKAEAVEKAEGVRFGDPTQYREKMRKFRI